MSEASLEKDNILFLINSLDRGGAENMFIQQANSLSAHGFSIFFGLMYGAGKGGLIHRLVVDDRQIHDLKFKSLFDIFGFIQLLKIIKKEQISIIYSTLEEANVLSRAAGIFCPRVRIFTRESNDASLKIWKFKMIDRLLNFVPEKIVAVSNGVKKSLLGYQKLYSKKIIVIENGVKIKNFDYEKAFSSKPPGTINILNVGNLTPQKDQITLLKAFKGVADILPNIKLTIVGDGILRKVLEAFIANSGLHNKVKLVGSVSKEEVESYYQKSDFFVLSSLWEGFPNALLEAASYGLPLVATRTSGSVDVIEDQKTGFLVDDGDEEALKKAMILLASDSKLRFDMGKKNFDIVARRYSMESNIKNLLRILQ